MLHGYLLCDDGIQRFRLTLADVIVQRLLYGSEGYHGIFRVLEVYLQLLDDHVFVQPVGLREDADAVSDLYPFNVHVHQMQVDCCHSEGDGGLAHLGKL